MTKRLIVLLSFLGLFVDQGCQTAMDPVQWGKEYHYGIDETFPIKMGKRHFPLIPGKINNREVKVFFDTGNFFGFQIGPGLVRTLELAPSGNERKNYDSRGTFRYAQKGYHIERFTVCRTEFKNIEMFEMTDSAFEASVGIEPLLGGRFTVDYKNRLMGISNKPVGGKGMEMDGFPLIWNDKLKGMIVIEGTVNGIETLFQIDTGKSRTTIDEDLIGPARLKKNNTLFLQGYQVDLITLGKKGFFVECAKVANFKAISEGYPGPILMGIGADILSQIVLTVDYLGKKVYIK